MNLSSGGLAVVAIGAIWFLVFLPSFIRGDKNQAEETNKVSAPRVENNLGTRALKALKAKRARTISATLAAISFVVAGLSILELATTGAGLPLSIGSVAVFALFTWLTVRNNRKYGEIISNTSSRNISYSAPLTKKSLPEQNENTWQPDTIPNQNFLRTGAIEVVELADVVSLEEQKTSTEISNIDEILRRRRHVG